ncbi:MAG TPA: hypothetical protein VGA02_06580 [Gemmatimonadales bacterium]
MPTNKDLKRLIRTRMQKTGESYTSARAQLLRQPASRPAAAPASPAPADFARLAGMSNDTVKAKTGCAWDRWVYALDKLGAAELPHREIARLVREKYEIPGWWAQAVTVGYERIRGLRAIGQRRDGAYEASKSKTMAVPVASLYRAFRDARLRKRWLDVKVTVRIATPDKTVRFGWDDGTIVQAYFTPKGKAKTAVAIQHMKLKDRAAVERSKAYWGERLGVLAETIVAR